MPPDFRASCVRKRSPNQINRRMEAFDVVKVNSERARLRTALVAGWFCTHAKRLAPVTSCDDTSTSLQLLEREFSADLQLPRRAAVARCKPGTGDLAERRRLYIGGGPTGCRLPEVRVIQDVERICAQDKGDPLGNARLLLTRHVPVGIAGAGGIVALYVADSRVRRWCSGASG